MIHVYILDNYKVVTVKEWSYSEGWGLCSLLFGTHLGIHSNWRYHKYRRRLFVVGCLAFSHKMFQWTERFMMIEGFMWVTHRQWESQVQPVVEQPFAGFRTISDAFSFSILISFRILCLSSAVNKMHTCQWVFKATRWVNRYYLLFAFTSSKERANNKGAISGKSQA